MARTRTFRIAGAGFLVGAVALTVAPHAVNTISTAAVVNAPLISVAAPRAGEIRAASPDAGAGVRAGDLLVAVADAREDRRRLSDLTTRRAELAEQLAALRAQAREMDALAEALALRAERFEAGAVAALEEELKAARAEAISARAESEAAAAALARVRDLAERGHASAADLDTRTARAAAAKGRAASAAAGVERLSAELDQAREGAFVGDGRSDVPYSRQRLDEVQIRRSDLRVEIARLESERRRLSDRIAAEREQIAREGRFAAAATTRGVVWRASPPEGAQVAAGAPLVAVLDCTRRFVEVHVSERHFESLRPGDRAEVRLKGGAEPLAATVSSVRGAGALTDRRDLAAAVPDPARGQLQVLVDLEPAGLDREPATHCHVGRTAEVKFPTVDFGPAEEAGRTLARDLSGAFARGVDLVRGLTGGAPGDEPADARPRLANGG